MRLASLGGGFAAILVAAGVWTGCSDRFQGCLATRTCPRAEGGQGGQRDGDGATGEAGDNEVAQGGDAAVDDGGGGVGVPESGGSGGAGGEEPTDHGVVTDWAQWAIPNAAGLNLPNIFNYDTDTREITIDQVTGLVWQSGGQSLPMTWQEASDACEGSTVGGFTDWRLPKRIELVSLVDYSKSNPAVDSVAFPLTKKDYYWSATPAASAPNRYWQVEFAVGSAFPEDEAQKYYVRCVRGAASVPAAHYTVGEGYVLDNFTHLMWEYPKPNGKSTFAEADSRCASLTLADTNDWRLPTAGELQSLIDHAAVNPAIDRVFTDVSSELGENDWSSSTLGDGLRWAVQWQGGVTPQIEEVSLERARCVRFKP